MVISADQLYCLSLCFAADSSDTSEVCAKPEYLLMPEGDSGMQQMRSAAQQTIGK